MVYGASDSKAINMRKKSDQGGIEREKEKQERGTRIGRNQTKVGLKGLAVS
ncbi:MAG: hypothetical protein OD814_001829 [Candidatus Alkanophagales archaeon MCA70_species_1]|nr:hypothetical protein [Candidatus Alkanophaga volatiphilum]